MNSFAGTVTSSLNQMLQNQQRLLETLAGNSALSSTQSDTDSELQGKRLALVGLGSPDLSVPGDSPRSLASHALMAPKTHAAEASPHGKPQEESPQDPDTNGIPHGASKRKLPETFLSFGSLGGQADPRETEPLEAGDQHVHTRPREKSSSLAMVAALKSRDGNRVLKRPAAASSEEATPVPQAKAKAKAKGRPKASVKAKEGTRTRSKKGWFILERRRGPGDALRGTPYHLFESPSGTIFRSQKEAMTRGFKAEWFQAYKEG